MEKEGDISDVYKKVIEEDKAEVSEELSWESKYRDVLKEAMQKDPNLKEKLNQIPERSRLKRSTDNKEWVVLFAKKGANICFSWYNKMTDEVQPLLLEEWFSFFEASENEQANKVSAHFYEYYDKIKTELHKPNAHNSKNPQEKKALENIKMLYQATKNSYFKDLEEVISLWNLPACYMTEIRTITQKNRKEVAQSLQLKISQSYLNIIKQNAQAFDEQQADLIISEEF